MADPRRIREMLGFGYGAPSPAMSALEPFHAGVDPAYMPEDVVTASPTEGPRGWVRSGLESLFGAIAPSDRAASNMAEKVTNLSDFVNLPQEAFDVGQEIGNTLQGGDPRMLAMSLIPGKAEEVVPLVKQAQKKLKAYHTTRNDFDKFGPAPEYRGSTYLALTPEGAKKGSTGGAQDFPDVGDRRPQRLLEVELPDEGIQGLHWTPKEREWFDSMPDRIEGDEALNAAFEGQPNNGSISWDDIYEPRQIGDRLYEYIKKPPKTYSLDDVVKTNRDIYGGQLPGYQDRDVETAKRLREAGMKGYLLNDEAGVSIAHIDPETLEIVPAVKAAQEKIRAYHGSNVPIEKLSHAKAQDRHGRQNALGLGRGKFYFSKDEPVARSYSLLRGADKPIVNEADLDVRNPIHEDEYGKMYKDLSGRGINEPYDYDYRMDDRDMYIEQLDRQIREKGHDAIINDVGQVAIFDPDIVTFIKKYGIAGALGAGLITQQMADQLQAQQGGGQS